MVLLYNLKYMGEYQLNDKEVLEERLTQIVHMIESIEEFINDMDLKIPESAKNLIIKTIRSKEIDEIIDGIKEKRPPRLAFIGRSGVGKSSLINAMMGSYLAETSAVEVGTEEAEVFQYKKDNEVMFEIIDTRGFKENLQASENTAEDALEKMIAEFEPDAFLMLNNGADRSTLREDAKLLKKFSEKVEVNVPLITVITRVDQLEPSRIMEPEAYTPKKKANIKAKEEQVKSVLQEVGISNAYVIPVSAYIEWNDEDPEALTEEEREALVIEFDGRYNIDKLTDFLIDNIDFRAAVYMMSNERLDKAIQKLANKFVKVFSTASAGVAATPIPASDIFVLVPIQMLQVTLIAYLNGTKLNAKAARDFIMSLGGIAIIGLGLRFAVQQSSKLLNLVLPVVGSAISSGVAYSGTYAIGQAAISYYVDGKTKTEIKNEMKKSGNK